MEVGDKLIILTNEIVSTLDIIPLNETRAYLYDYRMTNYNKEKWI